MEIRRKFWVEQRSHAIWAVELHDHLPVRATGHSPWTRSTTT